MRKKDKTEQMKKIAIGATVAAAAGYVAGLLTAPQSGKETRADISRTAKKSVKMAEKEYKKLHKELDGLVKDVKSKSADLSAKASKELNELTEMAKVAKDKAGEMISAVKNGEADDKDLKKAISDANKAIDNVRKYLKK